MTSRTVASALLGLAFTFGLAASGAAQQTASSQPEAAVGGLLASPQAARTASLDPELDSIAAALGSIAASKAIEDRAVKSAVEHGKRAVLLATRALAAGDAAAAARKKAIAQAALELAARAAARREETRAESAASQNVARVEQEKAQAAVLLEQAREQLKQRSSESP